MDAYPEVIETERLLLRPYVRSDAPRVLDVLSRMDVIRWLDNPPFVPMADLAAAEQWVERVARQHREDPRQVWRAVQVRETGAVAGTVLVSRAVRIDGGFVGEYELGWHLHPDSHGLGYATEAARALAAAAFAVGHESLVVGMYPDNAPSLAVALRIGARDLGEREDPWYGGTSRLLELVPDGLSAS